MILPRLVDAGGGSSRLGGLVQRGLGLFRKSFFKKVPAEPDQGLLVQGLRCRPIVPPPPEPVLAAVRRGAREILSTYLARNRIQTVAAEMGRRYAFRLMSGPVGFNPGLRSRIAIYGFVGIGFGNAVCNRDNQRPLEDSRVQELKDLFSPEHNEQLVSKKVEEDTFSVVECPSISSDSDIAIPSDDNNDFEILESSAVLVVAEETDWVTKSDSIVSAEVLELQEVVDLENKQQAEICSLIQKVCQENKVLRNVINTLVEKIVEYQSISDDSDIAILSDDESDFEILESSGVIVIAEESGDCVTKSDSIVHDEVLELQEVVEMENKQQTEINSLVWKLCQENKVLRDIINTQIEKTGGRNPKSNGIPTWDMVCERECNGSEDCNSLENEREKLRAAGGRTRALKIHRKQRFKRNRMRFVIQRALNRRIKKRLDQLSQQLTKLEEKMRHYDERCC